MSVRKLQHPEVTLEGIKLARKRIRSYQSYQRLLGLELLLKGSSRADVGAVLGVHRNTVSDWITRANERGLAVLEVARGRGRKRRLGASDKEKVKSVLLQSPREQGYQQNLWTGKLIREYLKEKYDCEYKRSSIYPLLRSMGLSIQRPNRLYGEADKEQQVAFKKNSKI